MFKRLDHRVGRSSQATSAAVNKSIESLKHKKLTLPHSDCIHTITTSDRLTCNNISVVEQEYIITISTRQSIRTCTTRDGVVTGVARA